MATPSVVPIRDGGGRKRELGGLPARCFANPGAEAAVDLMGALRAAMEKPGPVRHKAEDPAARIKRKTDQCGRVVLRLKAEAKRLKDAAAALNKQAARKLARLERIEGRAVAFLGDTETKSLIGIGYTLTSRPNAPSLIVDDAGKVPSSYLHEQKAPPPREPDKVAIKTALQRADRKDATVAEKELAALLRQACHLEQSFSLIVTAVE